MRNQKRISLACVACGAKSPSVVPPSPAAPVLTACETLHRVHGWSFEVGFWQMLTGDHRPRCASCTADVNAIAGAES